LQFKGKFPQKKIQKATTGWGGDEKRTSRRKIKGGVGKGGHMTRRRKNPQNKGNQLRENNTVQATDGRGTRGRFAKKNTLRLDLGEQEVPVVEKKTRGIRR